jgi:hypothetical protein
MVPRSNFKAVVICSRPKLIPELKTFHIQTKASISALSTITSARGKLILQKLNTLIALAPQM